MATLVGGADRAQGETAPLKRQKCVDSMAHGLSEDGVYNRDNDDEQDEDDQDDERDKGEGGDNKEILGFTVLILSSFFRLGVHDPCNCRHSGGGEHFHCSGVMRQGELTPELIPTAQGSWGRRRKRKNICLKDHRGTWGSGVCGAQGGQAAGSRSVRNVTNPT